MKERTFTRIMIAVILACVLFTLAHFAYAIYAYKHCSIIYFIAKELW